jgi:hypothetical protein
VVGVERSFHFDGGPVIVAMQPFALISFVGDEVATAEDEVILRHADPITLSHGLSPGYFNVDRLAASRRRACDTLTLAFG